MTSSLLDSRVALLLEGLAVESASQLRETGHLTGRHVHETLVDVGQEVEGGGGRGLLQWERGKELHRLIIPLLQLHRKEEQYYMHMCVRVCVCVCMCVCVFVCVSV